MTAPTNKATSWPARNEHGQTLALFGGVLILLLAMVGVVVDVGSLLAARSQAQKAADAGALAGAQALPDQGAALGEAHTYITTNAPTATDHTHVVTTQRYANDTLTVTVTKDVSFTFLRVVGVTGKTVSATATSQRVVFSGAFPKNMVPWGIVASDAPERSIKNNACYLGNDAQGLPIFQTRTSCTIKYGSSTDISGEFGPIRLAQSSSGADIYRDHVKYGSPEPRHLGDVVEAETGNMAGPTRDGVEFRMAQPAPPGCPGNTRADALIDNPDGTTSIRPGCEEHPRIVVIPVVDQLGASLNSRILGFAFMWLEGMDGAGGEGKESVRGEFLNPITRLPDGTYEAPYARGASAIVLLN